MKKERERERQTEEEAGKGGVKREAEGKGILEEGEKNEGKNLKGWTRMRTRKRVRFWPMSESKSGYRKKKDMDTGKGKDNAKVASGSFFCIQIVHIIFLVAGNHQALPS